MVTKPAIYLDSCCFIDAVKEQVKLLPEDRTEDVWHLKQLFRAHQNGEVALFTSMLSLAECVAVEKAQSAVPENIQERFRRLLTSGQYVFLHTQTPRTGKIVQDMRWEHGLVLGGPDCLHVAAALEVGCVEFITTDERLQKAKFRDASPKITALGMRLIKASNTEWLPPEYRQGKWEFDGG
ncbi:MAG: PIN domain-containing protein [Rhizomicrobium sp.]